jgi:protein-S-isoprenylcysteine O-methyltransferase Ste14
LTTTPEPAAAREARPVPRYARFVRGLQQRLVNDMPGGPRLMRFSTVINFQKCLMFVYLGALMWLYDGHTAAATGTAAWIYLALHGSYGMVWYLKDKAFPDPGWQHRLTLPGALNAILGVLGWYWLFGWLLISGRGGDYPIDDKPWFALCITLVVLGSVVMIAADAQKFFTLRVQRGLITDGMFRFVRHPNYTGEMMIYLGFALMVWHWLPFVVLAWVWGGLFAANMLAKEASMSRYPEWAAYKARTHWVIPHVL